MSKPQAKKTAHHRSGRRCDLSGKAARKGWRYSFLRSHYNPTAKCRYQVNLQKVRTYDENGQPITLQVAASVLKRCPEITLGVKHYLGRHKLNRRLKGAKKRELLASLASETETQNN